MAFDVYRLHAIECPECHEEGTLRIMLSVEGEDDDVIICRQCENEIAELDPGVLAAVVQEVLKKVEQEGDDITKDDIVGVVNKVMELDK